MTLVRITIPADLASEAADMLNEAMNVMGMQAAADQGLLSQSEVDAEVARLEEKYGSG